MGKIRVLLVDDHPVVRGGVRTLLQKTDDIQIVGEASGGREALQLVQAEKPDVVVLDMELPDMHGTEVALAIRRQFPQVKILSLSAFDDPTFIRSLLEVGAEGYLMKEEAPQVIVDAVRGVARGEQGWFSHRISARLSSVVGEDGAGQKKLTVREHQTLLLIIEGRTNQAIAAELQISEKTVEKYVKQIFAKLNVTSRVEAAVHAVRQGLK